jgi:hypothetical protein
VEPAHPVFRKHGKLPDWLGGVAMNGDFGHGRNDCEARYFCTFF